MSLLEKLEGPPPSSIPLTRIGRLLVELTPQEKAALEKTLADPRWSHQDIARVLCREGHPTTEKAVWYYRQVNGLC